MTEVEWPGRRKWNFRRMGLIVGALLAIGIVVLVLANREVPPQKAPPLQARLELAAGEVRVSAGANSPANTLNSAVSGAALSAGARIETGRGARALVRLPEGSSLFLRSNTRVALGENAVALEGGEYWLDAPPNDRKALVHTASGVEVSAADAGLSIRYEKAGATIYVARGTASVNGTAGRVEVRAGERAVVVDGKPRVSPVAFWDDWTGGMADSGGSRSRIGSATGSIYGVDESVSGDTPRRLEIAQQQVRAVVREGLSETEVDQTFFNPGERAVEGWYWFTVPTQATVTGFAVETNGTLVEGEFIERREAAAQYADAKASGAAPAILEYVDAGTYRARIYPVPAGGTRRVVLRYLELRPVADKLEYVYPMGTADPVRIGDFSLTVDLGEAGKSMKIATLADARLEQGGRLVTMRRSGYTPRAPFQLQAALDKPRPPLTVARFNAGDGNADYVLARYLPDVDWANVEPQRADVVVVVDTSAAGDEGIRQLKVATAEAILRALSEEDRFALISLDVRATVLHPKAALAPAADAEIERALESLAGHASGGATDLAAFFDEALGRVHGTEQPAIVYVGDGLATSGELSGEQIIDRLRRALSTSRARLFTVGVGTDADLGLLSELSRVGGGETFSLQDAEQTTARALELAAAIKSPTLTDFELDLGAGLDEVMTNVNGKLSRGAELTLLARTHHDIPKTVRVRGRVGGKAFERSYAVKADASLVNAFVPRLWAAESVRRLLGRASGPDGERGRIVKLGVDYGLMTPYTSVLALDSEYAYQQRGIPRNRSRLRGVRLGALDGPAERRAARGAELWSVPRLAFGCSKESSPELVRAAENDSKASAVQAVSPPSPTPPAASVAPAEAPGGGAELANSDDKEFGVGTHTQGEEERSLKEALSDAREPMPSGALALGGAKPSRSRAKQPLRAARTTPSTAVQSKPSPPAVPLAVRLGVCSDAAARPLSNRVALWRKRLAAARTGGELVARYDAARSACELSDWQAERSFLALLQRRIADEATAELVLRRFQDRPEVQKYVAKLILRRTVDVRLIAAVERVLYGAPINWLEVDLKLSAIADPAARLVELRTISASAPNDPNAEIRIVQLLLETGKREESLVLGRRLREQGALTPDIARELGDVLATAGLAEEAVRVYSEIVEFDPTNVASRRLLGDIFLRHGWYDPAYRQYRTLTQTTPADALGWLRLASAAAGAGRVDEALRLERQVANAEGTPGPEDPRRWARLWSAARLATLLTQPGEGAPAEAEQRRRGMERELKELGLFSGPGRLLILTWSDPAADLALVTRQQARDLALGDVTDAAPAGLSAALLSTADAGRTELLARLRSHPERDAISLTLHSIEWDSKRFHVTRAARTLNPGATEAAL